MPLDYDTLHSLRQNHPAWRLLCATNAPLIGSFLEKAFIVPNKRVIAEGDLIETLEDELFARRQGLGEKAFPKRASEYLADWAAPEHGWIRRFYDGDSDEPSYDLTPATEKAISWLNTLVSRQFVGTESRLLTLFELLRQISEGTDDNPDSRRADLVHKREQIDQQIAALDSGHLPLLDDTSIRDRFQQFTALARELLSDFREVEDNFRKLDRETRESIARWEGSKGELLADILDERDVITKTDQGRSFQAFFDFLMSPNRQEELGELLKNVLELPAIEPLSPDRRLRKVHHDWHIAAEHAQSTVRALSKQLRQFLDDQAWLENRRILEIIKQLEHRALDVRADAPRGEFFSIDSLSPQITLPMERPLHTLGVSSRVNSVLDEGVSNTEAAGLYGQIIVDREALVRHAHSQLQQYDQISLAQLIDAKPLVHGLSELVVWLQVAESDFGCALDDTVNDTIVWHVSDDSGLRVRREAQLPRILLVRR